MDVLINRIKKIQNKQHSLRWGHYPMSNDEIMFAVGSAAYPKMPQFFTVTSNHEIFLLDEMHKRNLYGKYKDEASVVKGVISLLKEWFPAKQLSPI